MDGRLSAGGCQSLAEAEERRMVCRGWAEADGRPTAAEPAEAGQRRMDGRVSAGGCQSLAKGEERRRGRRVSANGRHSREGGAQAGRSGGAPREPCQPSGPP